MPYIPKKHEKYNVLPFCKENGGEVFVYPSDLLDEVEELIGTASGLIPYGYKSYDDYFNSIDLLIDKNADRTDIIAKIEEFRDMVRKMNQKEEWSILRYIGPSSGGVTGLTNGKIYYWPTRKECPVHYGVIDDEEFTTYLYPTDSSLWEILEDPTGMAYRTIFEIKQ